MKERNIIEFYAKDPKWKWQQSHHRTNLQICNAIFEILKIGKKNWKIWRTWSVTDLSVEFEVLVVVGVLLPIFVVSLLFVLLLLLLLLVIVGWVLFVVIGVFVEPLFVVDYFHKLKKYCYLKNTIFKPIDLQDTDGGGGKEIETFFLLINNNK